MHRYAYLFGSIDPLTVNDIVMINNLKDIKYSSLASRSISSYGNDLLCTLWSILDTTNKVIILNKSTQDLTYNEIQSLINNYLMENF